MKAEYKAILTTPTWNLGGANMVGANLVKGLVTRGLEAFILITRPDLPEPLAMSTSGDLPFANLPQRSFATWRERCNALMAYLEAQAPCIYLPNCDWGHSCIGPKLSRRVVIVGIMHSVDPIYIEYISRLGAYWNGIVAVSKAIAEMARKHHPELASKIFTIPNGVDIPPTYPKDRPRPGGPLRLIFVGRIVQHPKRVLDLPKILLALQAMHVPVELTVVGAGEDQERFEAVSRRLLETGAMRLVGNLSNEAAQRHMRESDVFLLTSEFEGMPLALIEAMGQGCVPVVSNVTSGVPELIEHGINGFRLAIGDIPSFVDHIAFLHRDPERRKTMSRAAYEKVVSGGYRIRDMARSYDHLFRQLLEEVENGTFVRPRGEMAIPIGISPWNYRLPNPLARMVLIGKAMLRRIGSPGT